MRSSCTKAKPKAQQECLWLDVAKHLTQSVTAVEWNHGQTFSVCRIPGLWFCFITECVETTCVFLQHQTSLFLIYDCDLLCNFSTQTLGSTEVGRGLSTRTEPESRKSLCLSALLWLQVTRPVFWYRRY